MLMARFNGPHVLHIDDSEFKSDSHDDHLHSLHDLIAYDLQEFDNYEDPHVYSCKKNHTLTLLGLCTRDGL